MTTRTTSCGCKTRAIAETRPLRLLAAVALAALAALVAAEAGAAKTVWLCKPGLQDDPCSPSLTTTVFSTSLEIDSRPRVRRRLISALLLVGGVTVRAGRDSSGDFRNVRACRSARQLGCVVAFSTFNAPVPPNAVFGRAGAGLEVLCTNPAALGGGPGKLDPLYPSRPFAPGSIIGQLTLAVGAPMPSVNTAWLSFPGSYRAPCSSADGANVLQVSPLGKAPVLNPVPEAGWGLHLVDGTIALGNLTELVRRQADNYVRRR
jgi:Protein of unknown function (DUF3089)